VALVHGADGWDCTVVEPGDRGRVDVVTLDQVLPGVETFFAASLGSASSTVGQGGYGPRGSPGPTPSPKASASSSPVAPMTAAGGRLPGTSAATPRPLGLVLALGSLLLLGLTRNRPRNPRVQR